MYFRLYAAVLILVLSAVFALQYFVQSHVQGVAIAHAQDKGRHMTEILEHDPDLKNFFDAPKGNVALLSALRLVARDGSTQAISFFDETGAPIDLNDVAEDAVPAVHDDHAGHDERTDRTQPHPQHEHDHELDGNQSFYTTADAPISPDALTNGPLLTYSSFYSRTGVQNRLVETVFPVRGFDGAELGFICYKVSVNDIVDAYSSGLGIFAIVLTAFGAAIFGVPTLGYFLQKKLADMSTKNAKYLADFDALTGLLNRGGFLDKAASYVQKGITSHIVYIDADEFKAINDTYGHSTGDAYLTFIARQIDESFGPSVLSSRIGGDEFVIAFSQRDVPNHAGAVADLLARCAQEIELNGVTVKSSISIGVAPVRRKRSLDQALKDADMALYFAKAKGGNSQAYYDKKMSFEIEERRALETRLREATENNDFFLHYQPLINAKNQTVFGHEALLRLKGYDDKIISPAEFIPVAEEMGLINDIGTWVIYTAIKQTAEFNDHGMVAINLSAEQFKSGKLVNIVTDALAQANMSAHRVELEITESLLIENSTSVSMQIDALKDLGVSVAMDDFGTGFSSLSYLWKFGFDRIKIDRSFIHALEENPERSLGLIESIVMIGEKLGMSITAEGIETQNQSRILSSMGCDILQGFYYGRPEPLGQRDEAEKDEVQKRA